jgi:hypothetical protein
MVLGRCGAPGRSGAPVLYAHSRQLGRLAQLPKGNNWTLRRPEKLDRVSHSFEQETGATPATSYQLTKGITKQSGLIRKNKIAEGPMLSCLRRHDRILPRLLLPRRSRPGSCSLDWRRYQPMWQPRMTSRALAATTLRIIFQYRNIAR